MDGAALTALREASRQSQHALELSALWQRVMSHDVTLDDYRQWLQAHLAVAVPWSEACPNLVRQRSRCDPTTRVDALHLDIAVLGEIELRESRGVVAFDWPPESAAWWGALFVFESSRMHARSVARHLRQELGFCVSGALRYLDPVNGVHASPAWSSIVHALERRLATADARREAIVGAEATLEFLRAALGRESGGPGCRSAAAA